LSGIVLGCGDVLFESQQVNERDVAFPEFVDRQIFPRWEQSVQTGSIAVRAAAGRHAPVQTSPSHLAELTDREAATDCGGRLAHHMITARQTGVKAMRSALAVGLLIALCASANAAPVHRSHKQIIVRPNQGVTAPPGRFAVPGWSDDATRRWLDNASSGWSHA
jgi:hypothetical protein